MLLLLLCHAEGVHPAHLVRVGQSPAADARTVAAGLARVPASAIDRWTLEIEPGVYVHFGLCSGHLPVRSALCRAIHTLSGAPFLSIDLVAC